MQKPPKNRQESKQIRKFRESLERGELPYTGTFSAITSGPKQQEKINGKFNQNQRPDWTDFQPKRKAGTMHINGLQRLLFTAGSVMIALHCTYYPNPIMLLMGVVIAAFFFPGNDGDF